MSCESGIHLNPFSEEKKRAFMHNNLKLVDADKYTPEQKNKVYAD
jgi:hypothetical protein